MKRRIKKICAALALVAVGTAIGYASAKMVYDSPPQAYTPLLAAKYFPELKATGIDDETLVPTSLFTYNGPNGPACMLIARDSPNLSTHRTAVAPN